MPANFLKISSQLHLTNRLSFLALLENEGEVDWFTKCIDNGGGSSETTYPKQCNECGDVLSSRHTYYVHKKKCYRYKMEKCKANVTSYPKTCSLCTNGIFYKNAKTYNNHLKNIHKKSTFGKNLEWQCYHCSTLFTQKQNMRKHISKCMNGESKRRTVTCLEKDCKRKFSWTSTMIKHIENHHVTSCGVQNMSFISHTEFQKWRDETQLDTYMYPVQHSGRVVKTNKTYAYWVCNFNCSESKKKSYNRTALHSFSSCPARMFVHVYQSGKIDVRYFSKHTHVLSFENTVHHRLPTSVQADIKKYVSLNIPSTKIEDLFQTEEAEKETYGVKPRVSHFVDGSIIRNYRKRYKELRQLHPNDAVSVRNWVYTHRNDILVYKAQGSRDVEVGHLYLNYSDEKGSILENEDVFVLGIQRPRQLERMKEGVNRVMCVDATHGTNPYDFHLLNFVVPDEYGKLYPVAHFIMNSCDELILSTAISNLKNNCPDLKLYATVTDDDPALFNALENNFKDPNYRHILCQWHIRRSWQRNMNKVSQELRQEITEILDSLLFIRHSTNDFREIEKNFINKYSVDTKTKKFIDYYQTHYQGRPEKWASAFRNFNHWNTHTNMLAESFHSGLKNKYLEGKIPQRLDILLFALRKYEQFLHMELTKKRLLKVPVAAEISKRILNAHKKSITIPDEYITGLTSSSWLIKSQDSHDNTYTVIKTNDMCCTPDHCLYFCQGDCINLCMHLFVCNCPVRNSICKHIHKIHMLQQNVMLNMNLSDMNLQSNNETIPTSGHSCNNNVFSEEQSVHLNAVDFLGPNKASESDEKGNFDVTPKSESLHNLIRKEIHLLIENGSRVLPADVDRAYLHQILRDIRHTNQAYSFIFSDSSETTPFPHKTVSPNSKPKHQPVSIYQTSKRRRKFKINSFNKIPAIIKQINSEEKYTVNSEGIDNRSFTIQYDNYYDVLQKYDCYSITPLYIKSLDPYISQKELHSLQQVDPHFHRGWLYDEIIDAYLYILCSRFGNGLITWVPTHDSQVIQRHGFSMDILNNRHEYITNIYKTLFVPFNPNGGHWVLLVISDTEIKVLDPSNRGPTVNDSIRNNALFWQTVYNFRKATYPVITYPHHIIQSDLKDGISCGVFCLWYAKQILENKSIEEPFSINEMRMNIHDTLLGIIEEEISLL